MARSAIDQLELNIQAARENVELGQAFERLMQSPDFRKVILHGYLDREPVRLVHLKGDHAMQDTASQSSILRQMDAIGSLGHYFNSVRHLAALGNKSVAADEETRIDMLAEEFAI